MLRSSAAAQASRVPALLEALQRAYPDAHCELHHSNPLELLIATILSAQCTDKRVNAVTPDLFRRYPSAASYAAAPVAELEAARPSNGRFCNHRQTRVIARINAPA